MKALGTSKKYFNTWLCLTKASIAREMEYRADFFMHMFGSTIDLLSFLLFIEIIFSKFNNIGGWDKNEIVLIFGIATFLQSVFNALVYRNLSMLAYNISMGEMDRYFAKPMSALFLITFEDLNMFSLTKALIGIILAGVAASKLTLILSMGNIIALVLCIIFVFIIFYCILLIVFTLSFWLGKIDHAFWIYTSMSDISKLPVNVFDHIWRAVFVFVVPFTFFGAVPAGLLLGKIGYEYVLIGLVMAIFWVIVSRAFWRFGVRNYTSGGG